jgi:hypothetical protein
MELLIFFAILLTFALGIFILDVDTRSRIEQKKYTTDAEGIANTIENEIYIALKIGDGYQKTFNLIPPTESLSFYKVSTLDNGTIKIEWDNTYLTKKMPTKNITNGTSDEFLISLGLTKLSNIGDGIVIERA